jgi:hypothetical protein
MASPSANDTRQPTVGWAALSPDRVLDVFTMLREASRSTSLPSADLVVGQSIQQRRDGVVHSLPTE